MATNAESGRGRKAPPFPGRQLFACALGISTAFHALILSFLFTSPWGEEAQEPAQQVKLEPPPAPQKFIKRAPPNQRPLARSSQPQMVQRPLARKVSPKPVPRVAMSPVPLSGEAPRAGMPGVAGGAGGGGNLFSAGKGSGGLLGMGIGPGGGVPSRHIGPQSQAGANVLGQPVRRLVESRLSAGPHVVSWDGRDEVGQVISPGVYLVRLQLGTQVQVGKVVKVE